VRLLVLATLACLGLNFIALPVTSAALSSTLASIVVWGFTSMMLSIALQRRLIAGAAGARDGNDHHTDPETDLNTLS